MYELLGGTQEPGLGVNDIHRQHSGACLNTGGVNESIFKGDMTSCSGISIYKNRSYVKVYERFDQAVSSRYDPFQAKFRHATTDLSESQ